MNIKIKFKLMKWSISKISNRDRNPFKDNLESALDRVRNFYKLKKSLMIESEFI